MIKKCPLCGTQAASRMTIARDSVGFRLYDYWGVYCLDVDDCGCMIDGYGSLAAAIESWNHRFPSKEEGYNLWIPAEKLASFAILFIYAKSMLDNSDELDISDRNELIELMDNFKQQIREQSCEI